MERTKKTHEDLLPRGLCPSLLMKHILTHSLAEVVHDDRQWPGDGYYWCARTCSPVGPDDEIVHPKGCVPGRSCHDGLDGTRDGPTARSDERSTRAHAARLPPQSAG